MQKGANHGEVVADAVAAPFDGTMLTGAGTLAVTRFTAPSVVLNRAKGRIPRNTMRISMGVQASHSGRWTSWMCAFSNSGLGTPKATRLNIHSRYPAASTVPTAAITM